MILIIDTEAKTKLQATILHVAQLNGSRRQISIISNQKMQFQTKQVTRIISWPVGKKSLSSIIWLHRKSCRSRTELNLLKKASRLRAMKWIFKVSWSLRTIASFTIHSNSKATIQWKSARKMMTIEQKIHIVFSVSVWSIIRQYHLALKASHQKQKANTKFKIRKWVRIAIGGCWKVSIRSHLKDVTQTCQW